MPINNVPIAVTDLETVGFDPSLPLTQIACVMIDPRQLDIIPGSEYDITLNPELNEEGWIKAQGALDATKKNREDLEKGVSQKEGWLDFVKYIKKYNYNNKDSRWNRPILAGQNIVNFDMKFIQNMCEKYGPVDEYGYADLYYPIICLDSTSVSFLWAENTWELQKYNNKALKDWMGVPVDDSLLHNAVYDVKVTAQVIIQYLKAHRKFFKRAKFKGCVARGYSI